MGKTRVPAREERGAADEPRPAAGRAYFALVRTFPLRPIRSDGELDAAIRVIDSLVDKGTLSRDEDDYLDVLGDLVERYEHENDPLPDLTPADLVRYLIDERQSTQAAVAKGSGVAVSTLSAVLKGKRGLTVRQIESLARYFRVRQAAFIKAPE